MTRNWAKIPQLKGRPEKLCIQRIADQMWRVNLAVGRSASRRARMNHDSQYATAGYPQYSQIESKQVIFAGAPIKRACLRIFTRRWVNNGVSTRSRYTSSRLMTFSYRFPGIFHSISLLYSRTINPTAAVFAARHRSSYVHNHRVRSVVRYSGDRGTMQKQRVVLTYNNVVAAIKFPGCMSLFPARLVPRNGQLMSD